MSYPKYFLFILFPVIAFLILNGAEVKNGTIFTGDWRDVNVIGRGFFHTIDESGENPKWSKSLRLEIRSDGVLGDISSGAFRPVEPAVCIPSDWTKVSIDADGTIHVFSNQANVTAIGSLVLSIFAGEERYVNNPERPDLIPMEVQACSGGSGVIVQGVKAQSCLPLSLKVFVGLVLFIVYLVVVMILSNFQYQSSKQLKRKPEIK